MCEVVGIFNGVDPGITLNGNDLAAIYQAAGGNTRQKLREVRVALAEHMELGPVLVDASNVYRTPEDVARTKATNRRIREQAILDDLLPRYENTELRVARGEGLNKTLRWQRERIEELSASLARSR